MNLCDQCLTLKVKKETEAEKQVQVTSDIIVNLCRECFKEWEEGFPFVKQYADSLIEHKEEEYKENLNKRTITEIYQELNVTEHRYAVELSHWPTELMDKIKLLSSRLNDLNTYDDKTDCEGVFLGKMGYKKLDKVIYYLSKIEKIIS
ncbi:hypothetical protein [Cytobacillus oceanisediminis]|uniref:hypothetical protein n=1 Tax=Cytobacillus oceanisediminis TaxID=665099 RepID=UPI00203E3684|nr:hypothetical protein [Cytobacillus oceanisediminis]MCM3405465.1 hypothetical protein [Cytobacillus oceanisediminis]